MSQEKGRGYWQDNCSMRKTKNWKGKLIWKYFMVSGSWMKIKLVCIQSSWASTWGEKPFSILRYDWNTNINMLLPHPTPQERERNMRQKPVLHVYNLDIERAQDNMVFYFQWRKIITLISLLAMRKQDIYVQKERE